MALSLFRSSPHIPHLRDIAAFPLMFPSAMAGLDLASIAVELNGIFRKYGARSQPLPLDLAYRAGRLSAVAMATFVLESDRIARAVVTHVRAAPFYAGLAVVVHPRPELDAPLLVADLGIPPPGTTRVLVDACGPAITAPSFARCFRDRLAPVVDSASARGLRRSPVPDWLAPLSGGAGAQLRARPRQGETAARVLVQYIDRYLEALAEAEPAGHADAKAANGAAARSVRDVVRANGPAGRHLTRAFGAEHAYRYLALFWRDDAAP